MAKLRLAIFLFLYKNFSVENDFFNKNCSVKACYKKT